MNDLPEQFRVRYCTCDPDSISLGMTDRRCAACNMWVRGVFELLIEEALATANPWKDAMQAAFAVDSIKLDDHDPMGALGNMIRYNQGLALDPAVSAEAVALRDTYLERAERAEAACAAQAHTIKLLGRLGRAGMCIPTTDDEVRLLVDARAAARADPATAAVLNHDTERNDHGV